MSALTPQEYEKIDDEYGSSGVAGAELLLQLRAQVPSDVLVMRTSETDERVLYLVEEDGDRRAGVMVTEELGRRVVEAVNAHRPR